MGYALPYEMVKEIERAVGKEKAEIVIRVIEGGLKAVEEKAKEQKAVVKAEIKDELSKELVTKAELRETEERLGKVIESVRTEIHRWRADTIKWMFIFWVSQLAAFTGILIGILKWMIR